MKEVKGTAVSAGNMDAVSAEEVNETDITAAEAAGKNTAVTGIAEAKPAVSDAETTTAGKKTTAKTEKETTKAKRGPKPGKKAEKEELKPEIFVQFMDKEAVIEEVVGRAKAQFVAEGHRVSTIKSLQIYLKPEEYAAYYVINQKFKGRLELF